MSGDYTGRRRGQRNSNTGPASKAVRVGEDSKLNSDGEAGGDAKASVQERVLEEIVEWEQPTRLSVPVEMPLPEKVLTERWRINRVLMFQGVVTFLCLMSVVISPVTATQLTAVSICLGSLAFSRYALQRAYRNGR